ncbi:hypothetical protein CKJ89_39905, partial [Klebsiella pneumoniae]
QRIETRLRFLAVVDRCLLLVRVRVLSQTLLVSCFQRIETRLRFLAVVDRCLLLVRVRVLSQTLLVSC